jgi:hypothetical protein
MKAVGKLLRRPNQAWHGVNGRSRVSQERLLDVRPRDGQSPPRTCCSPRLRDCARLKCRRTMSPVEDDDAAGEGVHGCRCEVRRGARGGKERAAWVW